MTTVMQSISKSAKAFREGLAVGAENLTAVSKEAIQNLAKHAKYTGINKAVFIDGIRTAQTTVK